MTTRPRQDEALSASPVMISDRIELCRTDELIPYEKNARRHSKRQIAQIVRSFQTFGMRVPIVVDKDRVVVMGHGRLLAAKQLNLEVVPVVQVTDLSDSQVKALRIADNKLSDNSEFDEELLFAELKLIIDSPVLQISTEAMGFEAFEIDALSRAQRVGADLSP